MLFSEAINKALDECLQGSSALLCGQLVRYGHSALTTGLEKKYPSQVVTFPVSEGLMNASALGMALCGRRAIILHERFDFCIVGMDALVNHIPIWKQKCALKSLPLVILCVVGHGKGQGPQQNKNFSKWFREMEGWVVLEPHVPDSAYIMTKWACLSDTPTMVVIHRELY